MPLPADRRLPRPTTSADRWFSRRSPRGRAGILSHGAAPTLAGPPCPPHPHELPGHRHRQHAPEMGVVTACSHIAKLAGPRRRVLEAIDGLADGDWKRLPEPTSMLGCVGPATPCAAAWKSRWRSGTSSRAGGLGAHDAGVTNGYDFPSRLGADRWVALVGGGGCWPAAPRPALVVMVGTAVTVDALDTEGHFPRRPHPAGLRAHAEGAGDGTAGRKVPTGVVVDFPHQHQRRADERRRQRHCRRHRAPVAPAVAAHGATSRCC